ncbi:hypothetical protein [Thermomonas sp.]|uniref:hypothetical protein n=1 Tax=Thermomonas sp. TaxID=1971895 RepID=UPI002610E1E9|nr:hypothetical protein [Thermomonas sp.]MBL0227553.1 hypothetical protein [Thermomonas sp.]
MYLDHAQQRLLRFLQAAHTQHAQTVRFHCERIGTLHRPDSHSVGVDAGCRPQGAWAALRVQGHQRVEHRLRHADVAVDAHRGNAMFAASPAVIGRIVAHHHQSAPGTHDSQMKRATAVQSGDGRIEPHAREPPRTPSCCNLPRPIASRRRETPGRRDARDLAGKCPTVSRR